MFKRKEIFKKVAAGVMSFTMLCGIVNPVAYAKSENREVKYNADLIISLDLSASMKDEKLKKAKSSAKKMINSIWENQEDYHINTNIALITFTEEAKLHKNGDNDYFTKQNKDKLINEIDSLETEGNTMTQGSLYMARMMFRKSKADKKILVLLSDGEPNLSFEPKFDLKEYMSSDKEVKDNEFYYDRGKFDKGMDSEGHNFCARAEANLCKKENIDYLDIYTVAVDCNDTAKKLLEDIATDKGHAKDTNTSGLEDALEDLAKDIKNKIEKEEYEKAAQELAEKIEELENSKKELEKKLEEEHEKNEKDKDELNSKIEELENKIDEYKKEKEKAEEELNNKNSELSDRITDLENKTDELNKEKEKLEQELNDGREKSEKETEELKNKIEDLEKEIKANEDERKVSEDKLKEENTKLSEKISELENRINELQKEKDELKKDIEGQTSELKNKIEELKKEIDDLKNEKEELKDKLEKKIAEIEMSLDLEKEERKKDKEETDKNISDLNSRIDELNSKINELENAKNKIQKDLDDHKNRSEDEKDKLNRIIGKLDEKISELKEEREKLESSDKKQKDKIENLEKDIYDLKNTLEEERDKNQYKDLNLPEGVKLGQWYPEKVTKYPDKKKYNDGEIILLDGMKMKFRKVIKVNDKYIGETEEVNYSDIKNGYRGWNIILKTKVAKYDPATNGKMQIKFTMKYSDTER